MSLQRSAKKAELWLKENNLPYGDHIELNVSTETFPGGGNYGVEIPVVNNLNTINLIIKFLKEEGVYCTRFNETHGSILLSDNEIQAMLGTCEENGYGILISVGPRPEYDVKSTFYRSDFGLEMGRRLNNLDAIKYAIEEVFRLSELGCKGIIVYDEGLLRILALMRKKGDLPSDLKFKTSTHCMATNPFIVQIFAENGADSVTTAHDLGLPVLHEIRRLNPGVVLDVPTDVYKSKGGFIRFYELAEMVQIASPVFLKMGASIQGHPYDNIKEDQAIIRVKRIQIGLEYLAKNLPHAALINSNSEFVCLPKTKKR